MDHRAAQGVLVDAPADPGPVGTGMGGGLGSQAVQMVQVGPDHLFVLEGRVVTGQILVKGQVPHRPEGLLQHRHGSRFPTQHQQGGVQAVPRQEKALLQQKAHGPPGVPRQGDDFRLEPAQVKDHAGVQLLHLIGRGLSGGQTGVGGQQVPVGPVGIDSTEPVVAPDVVVVAVAVENDVRSVQGLFQKGPQVLFPLAGVPEDGQLVSPDQGAVIPIVLLQVPDPRGDGFVVHKHPPSEKGIAAKHVLQQSQVIGNSE